MTLVVSSRSSDCKWPVGVTLYPIDYAHKFITFWFWLGHMIAIGGFVWIIYAYSSVFNNGSNNVRLYRILVPLTSTNSDCKVNGTSMGPIWGRQDLGGPHGCYLGKYHEGQTMGIFQWCLIYFYFCIGKLFTWCICILERLSCEYSCPRISVTYRRPRTTNGNCDFTKQIFSKENTIGKNLSPCFTVV